MDEIEKRTVPANSDSGYYLTLVAVHGRCTCPDDFCHEEGPASCRLCAVLDGEYLCPSDPTAIDGEVYPDPDLVKIEGAAS